jgi:hypothetical protein
MPLAPAHDVGGGGRAAAPLVLEVCGLQGRAAVANGRYRELGAPGRGQGACYEQFSWGPAGAHADGPSYILYDGGNADAGPAWIVQVPGDPGKAYAYSEEEDAEQVWDAGGWQVWFCPYRTPIDQGVHLWYPATDFDEFAVRVWGSSTEGDERPGSALSRTQTARTGEASDSLDQVNDRIESLEDSVRNLDQPPLERTLIRLHGAENAFLNHFHAQNDLFYQVRLGTNIGKTLKEREREAFVAGKLIQLEGMLDEVMLGGLGGETPLRDRKQQYIDRVVAMQDNIDGQLAASRTKQPPSGRSGSSGGGGGGVASGGASGQQEPEPEFLVRTPSKRSGALDGELEAISLVMQKLEERGDEALLQGAKAAVEHAEGYSSSRSSLTSTGGVIGRILVALEHTVPAPRNA